MPPPAPAAPPGTRGQRTDAGSSREPALPEKKPARAEGRPAPETRGSTADAKSPDESKAALLAAIREQNKVFYGMVVAQAQKVEIEGDVVVFTFAPVHRTLRARLEEKRAWVEQLAQAASGRRLKVAVRESAAAPAPPATDSPAADRTRADLVARAQAEPSVQAVLDVFGGEIEDVEEMDGGKQN
jgi:hypothetical protein